MMHDDAPRQTRDEWLAEMDEYRKDPLCRLSEAMAALEVDLGLWSDHRAATEAHTRRALEKLHARQSRWASDTLMDISRLQRHLDQLRDAVVDQFEEFDRSYFTHEDWLAEQEKKAAPTGGAK